MAECCHHHAGGHTVTWGMAAAVTLHCLTGCAIGEFLGLSIGVTFGLTVSAIVGLSFVLAFISGFSLAVWAVKKRTPMSSWLALKTVLVGEIVSITVMEIVMNTVDYHMGGMQVVSVLHWQFWQGFIPAMVAGYVAALPFNYWLLKKNLKKCH